MYLTTQQKIYHYCQVREAKESNPNRRKAYRRVVTYLLDDPSLPNIVFRLRQLEHDCYEIMRHVRESGHIDPEVDFRYQTLASVFYEVGEMIKDERDDREAEEWERLRTRTQIAGTPLALLVNDIQEAANLSSAITLEACYELTIKSGEIGVFATLQELLCLLKSGNHEQHSLVIKFWKSVKQAIQTMTEQQEEEVGV